MRAGASDSRTQRRRNYGTCLANADVIAQTDSVDGRPFPTDKVKASAKLLNDPSLKRKSGLHGIDIGKHVLRAACPDDGGMHVLMGQNEADCQNDRIVRRAVYWADLRHGLGPFEPLEVGPG